MKWATTRPVNMWPEHWSTLSKSLLREAMKGWEDDKPRLGSCIKKQREIYYISSDDHDIDDIMRHARRKLERRGGISTALQSRSHKESRRTGTPTASEWKSFQNEDVAIENQRIPTETINQ